MRAALLLPILLASACRDAAVVTAAYATLGEARQAGAVREDRIPGGLPAGASDIRIAFDPEDGRRWGLFGFPPGEAAHLRLLLEERETPLDGRRCDVPRRIEWWPVMLRGPLDAGRIGATGLRTYRSRDGALLFAVNWNQGRAYFWSADTGAPEETGG